MSNIPSTVHPDPSVAKSSPVGGTAVQSPNYDHLVRPANRLLAFTAKTTWKMMKGLVRFAFSLPKRFVRLHKK